MRVKEILKERGISQKDFAAKLGMSKVGFSKTINEDGNPPLKRLQEISNALGIPIQELFEQPSTDVIICPKCGTKFKMDKE